MHPASLRIWRYHGAKRQNEKDQLHSNDVVLTTYATVAMESSGSDQVLRNVDWFRIVLDEGMFYPDYHIGNISLLNAE
jgi:SNF2 family DNA or RNA helicase